MKSLVHIVVVIQTWLFLSEATPWHCYSFDGVGRVVFESIDVDTLRGLSLSVISYRGDFSFSFNTKSSAGLVYYAGDLKNDYEGLFLRDGKLSYFIFNPDKSGHGSTSSEANGFEATTAQKLNDGQWHEVNFFRNKFIDGKHTTGLMVDGELVYKDSRMRGHLNIKSPYYIGGVPASLGVGVPPFTGQIRMFKERFSSTGFEHPDEEVNVKRCDGMVNYYF